MVKRQLNAGLVWWQFVPWVVSVSFLLLVIGLAVWGAQSSKMVSLTAQALADLGLKVEAKMNTWGKAWIGWMVTFYTLMGVASMVVAVWRRFLKVTSDSQGRKESITRGWLICHSVIITLWWIILLLLVLIIVGQTLWLVTVYAIDKAAMVGAHTIQRHLNATKALNMTIPAEAANICNSTCVDLSAFEIVLGTSVNNTCICNLTRIYTADAMVADAMTAVSGSTVGAVFMFVAATWMLMGSAADQGATRREISLLKAAASEGGGAHGLTRKASFWKRGKKKAKRTNAGGDASEGQELDAIPDEEEGLHPGQQPGDKRSSDQGGKGRASDSGKGKDSASEERSLLSKKAAMSDGGPQRSSESFLDRAGNLGKDMNRALSKSVTGAMSNAKKGSSKLLGKAFRMGVGI